MKRELLLIDLFEIMVTRIPVDRRGVRMRVFDLTHQLSADNPLQYRDLAYWEVREAIKRLCPIHKNVRQRTKRMKLNLDVATGVLAVSGIRHMPEATIRRCHS